VNTNEFRERLVQERARVANAISYLHEDNSRSLEDEAEEETFDQHPADAASITLGREIDTTLEENSEQVLRAIDDALARIEAGTYGTCGRCGNAISEARLEAMPYANKCIDCKRLEARA